MKKNAKFKKIPVLILLAIFALTWGYNSLIPETETVSASTNSTEEHSSTEETISQDLKTKKELDKKIETSNKKMSIDELTSQEYVIQHLKEHGKLPDYYITKNEARKLGWQTKYRNLCDAAPGKAIGGDHFGNFEKQLPIKKGRKYTEADINYNCGSRGQHRVVFSNDGLIFVTKNHYKSFEKK